MTWNTKGTHAGEGELAELVGLKHKRFIIQLKAGGELQTHRGVLKHDDLIGREWGSQVFSHLGNPFFLLPPALGDLLLETPRNTQIMYPKDVGFILIQMGISTGQHVLEAGSGSGALTMALAAAVGAEGKVTSYEMRPEMQRLAVKNITRLDLQERVVFKLGDIADGFEERNVDALFLDVPNPYDYIRQVRAALKCGGCFGSILPTTNQVTKLLVALRQNDFAFFEVCEVLLRYYRPEPERLRPVDRMVAHTGFLIFARPVLIDPQRRRQKESLVEAQGFEELDDEI